MEIDRGMQTDDWREFIHSDPDVLVGKPVVKGTRLSVDFILKLFGAGWTREEVLENYPTLNEAALSAVFAFAADCIQEDSLYLINRLVA
jgi:uncharacterized protein (DUF433 family)